MVGFESRRGHWPNRGLRQPLRGERDAAKESGQAGKSPGLPRRDGTDQGERRKGLRTAETTGETARRQTTKLERAPEEPLVMRTDAGTQGSSLPRNPGLEDAIPMRL